MASIISTKPAQIYRVGRRIVALDDICLKSAKEMLYRRRFRQGKSTLLSQLAGLESPPKAGC
ncbi:MAG: hypothetical protein ACLR7U_11390 [Ruthenibacterium lactatiformans]